MSSRSPGLGLGNLNSSLDSLLSSLKGRSERETDVRFTSSNPGVSSSGFANSDSDAELIRAALLAASVESPRSDNGITRFVTPKATLLGAALSSSYSQKSLLENRPLERDPNIIAPSISSSSIREIDLINSSLKEIVPNISKISAKTAIRDDAVVTLSDSRPVSSIGLSIINGNNDENNEIVDDPLQVSDFKSCPPITSTLSESGVSNVNATVVEPPENAISLPSTLEFWTDYWRLEEMNHTVSSLLRQEQERSERALSENNRLRKARGLPLRPSVMSPPVAPLEEDSSLDGKRDISCKYDDSWLTLEVLEEELRISRLEKDAMIRTNEHLRTSLLESMDMIQGSPAKSLEHRLESRVHVLSDLNITRKKEVEHLTIHYEDVCREKKTLHDSFNSLLSSRTQAEYSAEASAVLCRVLDKHENEDIEKLTTVRYKLECLNGSREGSVGSSSAPNLGTMAATLDFSRERIDSVIEFSQKVEIAVEALEPNPRPLLTLDSADLHVFGVIGGPSSSELKQNVTPSIVATEISQGNDTVVTKESSENVVSVSEVSPTSDPVTDSPPKFPPLPSDALGIPLVNSFVR